MNKKIISIALGVAILSSNYSFADGTTYQDNTTSITTEGYALIIKKPKSELKLETGQIGSGTYFIVSAILEAKKGKKMDGSEVLTSAVLGLSSLFGGISYVTKAGNVSATSSDDVRQFRKTLAYKNLVKEHGKDIAESITLDIYAGWADDMLIKKYVKDQKERDMLLALIKANQTNVTEDQKQASQAKSKSLPTVQAGSDGKLQPVFATVLAK